MKIAADTCVYTNHNFIMETINRVEADAAEKAEAAKSSDASINTPVETPK
jgi:hypothetical protein